MLKKRNRVRIFLEDTVPYNPYLSLKFNSHINIEFCASIKCIQYLFKYLYKWFDCMETETVIGTQGAQDSQEPGAVSAIKWDEIKQFQDNRYVSAPQAFWCMSKFPLTYRSQPIIRLAVHLRREQSVFSHLDWNSRLLKKLLLKILLSRLGLI